MKKLIIATAIAFGTLTVTNAQSLTADASIDDATEVVADVQDDFKEVKVSDLPQPVKDAIAKDLEGTVVSQAFANNKGEYKLVVTAADGASKELFANSKGEWLKKQ